MLALLLNLIELQGQLKPFDNISQDLRLPFINRLLVPLLPVLLNAADNKLRVFLSASGEVLEGEEGPGVREGGEGGEVLELGRGREEGQEVGVGVEE